MDYLQKDAEFIPLGSGEERSPGLHLTDIIKSLEDELGIGYKGDGFEDRFLTMEMGFWWEDVLERAWGDRSAVRIGEVHMDGVAGSPDGVGPDPGFIDEDGIVLIEPSDEIILEEYKLTWKSAKMSLDKVWKYVTQVKAYCYMLGYNVAYFRAVYVFGYWNGKGPLYREARMGFSDKELKDNWSMLVNHAKEKGML